MTKLGIMIEGQEGLNWERWRAICTDVERLGFASLRRSEHLISLMGPETSDRDCIDCWTSLTLAAEWTKTIQFGPMVSPLTFHMPAVLAKQATAVDLLSGGRLIFGIGAGWNENEHQVLEVPFLSTKERMDRLEEGVRIIKKTWQLSSPKPPRGGAIPIPMGGDGGKKTQPPGARGGAERNNTRLHPNEDPHKRQEIARTRRQIGRD